MAKPKDGGPDDELSAESRLMPTTASSLTPYGSGGSERKKAKLSVGGRSSGRQMTNGGVIGGSNSGRQRFDGNNGEGGSIVFIGGCGGLGSGGESSNSNSPSPPLQYNNTNLIRMGGISVSSGMGYQLPSGAAIIASSLASPTASSSSSSSSSSGALSPDTILGFSSSDYSPEYGVCGGESPYSSAAGGTTVAASGHQVPHSPVLAPFSNNVSSFLNLLKITTVK